MGLWLSARYKSHLSPNRNSVNMAVETAAIRLRVHVSYRTALPPVPDRLRPTGDGTMMTEVMAASRRP